MSGRASRLIVSLGIAAMEVLASIPPAMAFQCPAKQVRVQPGHAQPGARITIEGSGWFSGPCDQTSEGPEKGIEVSFVQGDRSWRLGTVNASAKPGPHYNGFTMTARVPGAASPGPAYVVAAGPTKSARKGFRVLAGVLPETGLRTGPFVWSGSALLLAAGSILVLARRGARITSL